MEKLASLLVSLGSGVLLNEGHVFVASIGVGVAVYCMKGLMFE